jgi:hypothetical protein
MFQTLNHQLHRLLKLHRRQWQNLIPKKIITLKTQAMEVQLTIIMATFIKTSMADLTQVGEVHELAWLGRRCLDGACLTV